MERFINITYFNDKSIKMVDLIDEIRKQKFRSKVEPSVSLIDEIRKQRSKPFMDNKEIKELLEKLKILDVESDKLLEKFEKEFEPSGTHYHQEFANEFCPFQNKYNSLSFQLIRQILEQQFGSMKYQGVYPAAGFDTKTCKALGGNWFLIDYLYDHPRDNIAIPSKEIIEAGYVPLLHSISNKGDLPFEIKPFSLDVSLIKRPGETNWTWCPDGLLKHAIEPLKSGGIMITELHLEYMLEHESEKGKVIVEGYLKQMERMKNLLGIDNLNTIRTFFYEENVGRTLPWISDFALYKKK